jgi:hypothetical protein
MAKASKPGSEAPADLPPELAQAFETIVERLQRRRRVNLFGYVSAILVLLLGVPAGLYYMGVGAPGSNRGWVLLLPMTLSALILWFCGRWAKKL